MTSENKKVMFINSYKATAIMNYQKKNTKIVATVSDLRCDPEFIKDLYDHGMNVVRLNTAHQDEEGTLKVIENVRKVSNKIALLLDTKGPEVRTANMEEPIEIVKGEKYIFAGPDAEAKDNIIPTSYENLIDDVPVGKKILVDDGLVEFIVIEKNDKGLVCEATNKGTIKKKKSVNVPDVAINLPALTEKDKRFIAFAAKNNLDFIAHSFVRNKEDLSEVQAILDEHKSEAKIIAKIENRQGVDNIDEIIDNCGGIMVARGDLAIEIPAAEVPLIQKQLIQKCVEKGKPVIVATQMLESMINQPRATRAEVSDIANAILDGTSAIMLSGETAYGDFPVEAVRTMSEVALDLHNRKTRTNPFNVNPKTDNVEAKLAIRAAELALELDAKAIVVPTISGRTARILSAMRTKKPIFATCYNDQTMRQLALSYGVKANHTQKYGTTDQLVRGVVGHLKEKGELNDEDLIVFIGGTNHTMAHKSNFLEIATVKDILAEYTA